MLQVIVRRTVIDAHERRIYSSFIVIQKKDFLHVTAYVFTLFEMHLTKVNLLNTEQN